MQVLSVIAFIMAGCTFAAPQGYYPGSSAPSVSAPSTGSCSQNKTLTCCNTVGNLLAAPCSEVTVLAGSLSDPCNGGSYACCTGNANSNGVFSNILNCNSISI